MLFQYRLMTTANTTVVAPESKSDSKNSTPQHSSNKSAIKNTSPLRNGPRLTQRLFIKIVDGLLCIKSIAPSSLFHYTRGAFCAFTPYRDTEYIVIYTVFSSFNFGGRK